MKKIVKVIENGVPMWDVDGDLFFSKSDAISFATAETRGRRIDYDDIGVDEILDYLDGFGGRNGLLKVF